VLVTRHTQQRDRSARYVARASYQEPSSRHDLGNMDVICSHCCARHWDDEKLKESSVSLPKFGMCCNQGKVALPSLPDPPNILQQLFTGDDSISREFRENIRQYNSALAFTSLRVNQHYHPPGGPFTFTIRGALYHRIGSLIPCEGITPSYAQLYIYDPHDAYNFRMTCNQNLSPNTMLALQSMLLISHQYATIYWHAYEILQSEGATELWLSLHQDSSKDRRRYNLPSVDEVAAVIPGAGAPTGDKRDVVVRLRTSEDSPLQRISDASPAYSALHYVLLFSYGTHGWTYTLTMSTDEAAKRKALSQTRYYAFRLQVRPNEFPTLLSGGRLFQEYVVDAWASSDQSQLLYLRKNQGNLRASLYSGLQDATVHNNDGDIDLNELGQRYILPSSYVCGPQYMQQLYQDAMAIGRHFKRIDVFLTVTANPSWPEIQRELLPHQTASDRPDLVARVFHMKLKALLCDIGVNQIFGHCVARIYTIEFQKRGLPHVHMLLFLDEPFKIRNATDIDSFISAQWPDPVMQPMLFKTVKACMIHRPCGALNPSSPCMADGKCTKHYPKEFSHETTLNEYGYLLYYRPDNGTAYEVRNHIVNNRWIVPYCPFLSAKYNCHVNVECAVSFASIKYVTKYLHKGHDRATLSLDLRDEIQYYLNSRYVSAIEGVWRMFHFEMHNHYPAVVRLQVHLPGQHLVTHNPDDSHAAILERAAHEKTMLTEFFKANRSIEDGGYGELAQRYTYQEFPEHFVWDASSRSQRQWKVRQRGWSLGRLYFVSPTAGERFYLRVLLTVVRGPTSFVDLRTFSGIVHSTFREACLARGLLHHDGESRMCLLDAAAMQTGTRLRRLFATVLIFCEPSEPLSLWMEFRQQICDDLQFQIRHLGMCANPTAEEAYNYGLYLLESILQESDHSLSNFPPMPTPREKWSPRPYNPYIAKQTFDFNIKREELMSRLPSLNAEQLIAYNAIIHSIEEPNQQGRPSVFFLDGPGGTGKTFVYQTICNKV
jgi:hypothetical protein